MTRPAYWCVFPLAFVALFLMLVGCNAGPTFQANRAGASIANTAANQTTWTDDTGTVTSSFQGTPPALMQVGDGSAAISAPGPHRVLSISQEPGGAVSMTLADPADTNFKGFAAELPDGTVVRIAEFSSSASAVISAYNEQVIAALEAQGVIVAEQGQTLRAAIAAGATLGEAIAELGIQAIVPVPKKNASPGQPDITPTEQAKAAATVLAQASPGVDLTPFVQLGAGGIMLGAVVVATRYILTHASELRKAERESERTLAVTLTEGVRECRAFYRELLTSKASPN